MVGLSSSSLACTSARVSENPDSEPMSRESTLRSSRRTVSTRPFEILAFDLDRGEEALEDLALGATYVVQAGEIDRDVLR